MSDSGPAVAARPARIWIVGPMGAGKSTTGGAAAVALGWRYLDNDIELARACGRSARELAEDGAGAVHAAELAVAESFFAERPPLVATLAASVVDVASCTCRCRSRFSSSGSRGPTGPGSARAGTPSSRCSPVVRRSSAALPTRSSTVPRQRARWWRRSRHTRGLGGRRGLGRAARRRSSLMRGLPPPWTLRTRRGDAATRPASRARPRRVRGEHGRAADLPR